MSLALRARELQRLTDVVSFNDACRTVIRAQELQRLSGLSFSEACSAALLEAGAAECEVDLGFDPDTASEYVTWLSTIAQDVYVDDFTPVSAQGASTLLAPCTRPREHRSVRRRGDRSPPDSRDRPPREPELDLAARGRRR